MKTSSLYLIATPLGNRLDITLRALEMLKTLQVFFAEDTREFSKLLALYEIGESEKQVFSYASHNIKKATERALEFLAEGKSLGLVTDRGTPAVSDPGALLVRAARERGHAVIPVPGPSSVTTLFSVSGSASNGYVFVGFLPLKKSECESLFSSVAGLGLPWIFLESPRRIRATLEDLSMRFPGSRCLIGREMTKVFEQFVEWDLDPKHIPAFEEKGEFTVLVCPTKPEVGAGELAARVSARLASEKEWSKMVAKELGVAAGDVYDALQDEKRRGENRK